MGKHVYEVSLESTLVLAESISEALQIAEEYGTEVRQLCDNELLRRRREAVYDFDGFLLPIATLIANEEIEHGIGDKDRIAAGINTAFERAAWHDLNDWAADALYRLAPLGEMAMFCSPGKTTIIATNGCFLVEISSTEEAFDGAGEQVIGCKDAGLASRPSKVGVADGEITEVTLNITDTIDTIKSMVFTEKTLHGPAQPFNTQVKPGFSERLISAREGVVCVNLHVDADCESAVYVCGHKYDTDLLKGLLAIFGPDDWKILNDSLLTKSIDDETGQTAVLLAPIA